MHFNLKERICKKVLRREIKMHNFFEGWYMKCQSDTQTLAVIAAVHVKGKKRTCSIQLITDEEVWNVDFSGDEFHKNAKGITIAENRFHTRGVSLSIKTPKLSVKGKLWYGPLTPLHYDIMGPFALLPFMECRHSVFSMHHMVNGTVLINGRRYKFENAAGYWEGDRGYSFPKEYLWTQCSFSEGSIMLSVAEIPFAGLCFTGIIGVVFWLGKEYRFATYLGARVIRLKNGKVRIVQRGMELEAELLEAAENTLKAPVKGGMVRSIHESAACHARYKLKRDGYVLFEFDTRKASFEYEYAR